MMSFWDGTPMGWGLMTVMMAIGWILILAVGAWLLRWVLLSVRGETERESALDILKKRYARGEISKEEFEEKKRELA